MLGETSENFLFSDGSDGLSNHRGTDGVDGLPFVTCAIWHQPGGARVQVRVSKDRPGSGRRGGKSSKATARILTSKIKQAKSAAELLDLLDEAVDGPIFNHFHASAAYTSLATWKRKDGLTPSDKESPVLPRLAARVQTMTEKGQVEPRTVANVLSSLGKLPHGRDIFKGLLMALVKSLGEKASGMNAQELSNSLLACVQLKGVAPQVFAALPELAAQISMKAKDMKPQELSSSLRASACLKDVAPNVKEIVPALVTQINVKARDMIPQQLSNSLWSATRLKDDAPEVLQMVPALVKEIPRNQEDFSSRQICNCLEALVLLWNSVPEVTSLLRARPDSKNDFVGFAAWHFVAFLPTLKRKSLQFDVPVVVWACASTMRYGLDSLELFASVEKRLKSGYVLRTLPDRGLCRLVWSYNHLHSVFFYQLPAELESERVRRGLSDADVSESAFGYF